ncbi:SpoU rRNA methylase family protein [Blattabacterium sp. (Blattella germanica) str. Bge]|uniref:TrmH family RNA methyltransferase n=1 Tax=Blattabacterium sp. (Blattella germanica) TaxID=624186 RepID=UPI0001BB6236|nr:TrmH family RNA methyltransferase [Blattabacterium sp. (Blattella germanica)]ACY40512.1 SpoU rRNA methylase family protein [Blattabacterium sp. (Blattella germanica) str. Bge]
MKKIHSLQNTEIKDLIKVYKKKNYPNGFLVEGVKEFEMAIEGNFLPQKIFICEKIFHEYDMIKSYHTMTCLISMKIFRKLAYRENSGGIIAFFREKSIIDKLINEKITNNSLILILDGIEKPGNIGAMLRTADAAGIHIIILCNMKTHIYNSNVIRCSLGSVFTRKIFIEKMGSIISWLQENKVKIVGTGFYNHQKAKNLYKTKLNYSNLAIIFGSENKGISNIWFNIANKIITIPMFGNVDSLNVSHAMSIIIYEIIRQRNYNFNL